MNHSRKFMTVLLLLLVQGCTTTYHAVIPKKEPFPASNQGSRELQVAVYVKNHDLSYEYSIFKKSTRFTEVSEETATAIVTLEKFRPRFVCGNPLIFSALTLGILPVSLPHGGIYSFTVESNGHSQSYTFWLDSSARTSIWEWAFKPFTSEAGALAKSLRYAKPVTGTSQPNNSFKVDG